MADYLAGTTTEVYFAGYKVGEITGFTKDPTIEWAEHDFVGYGVKQMIPIKQDATGTFEKLIPDWQMLALALGHTYYDTTLAQEVFESGENDGIFWRYLEVIDVPADEVNQWTFNLSTPPFPWVAAKFTARCPKINYIKLRVRQVAVPSGQTLSFDIYDPGLTTTVATFTMNTSDYTDIVWYWINTPITQTADLELETEYEIRFTASTTSSGQLDFARSFKYITIPDIRMAFVAGMMQDADDEGFVIRVKNRNLEGELIYIEEFGGVKFLKSGIEITPNDLTSNSLEWYASSYIIYKA